MRISDWSSDVCSSDLSAAFSTGSKPRRSIARCRASGSLMRCRRYFAAAKRRAVALPSRLPSSSLEGGRRTIPSRYRISHLLAKARGCEQRAETFKRHAVDRTESSEEHTSELQSLMRISYDIFGLKK